MSGNSSRSASTESIACSTCLCGTSRPTTHIVGVAAFPTRVGTAGSVPLWTTAIRGPVPPVRGAGAPELRERGASRARDRDVLAGAVQKRREAALYPPADASGESRGDDRPLLTMHVVDENDDGSAGDQPGQERHTVLDVDDEVDPPEPLADQHPQATRVDRRLRAASDVPHAVDRLDGRGGGVCGGEDRHPAPPGEEAGRHLVEVPLGSTTLGVLGVPPAEEDDVSAGEGGEVGHRATLPLCGGAAVFCGDRSPYHRSGMVARVPSLPLPAHRPWRADLRRSVRLFRQFRYEQSEPARFYGGRGEEPPPPPAP